jgi:hypothetical protein
VKRASVYGDGDDEFRDELKQAEMCEGVAAIFREALLYLSNIKAGQRVDYDRLVGMLTVPEY